MVSPIVEQQLPLCASWLQHLPPEEWSVYKGVISAARDRGIPFAVGGGLATMTYTNQFRETKDIDFFILKCDKDRMIRVLTEAGLDDYYEREAYERHWIYRSCREDIIVDVIWAMANRRVDVDEGWLNGPEVRVDGQQFRLVPPEETLWNKLYVLQRDRCDWPDGLSLVYALGPELDWRRLLDRLNEDSALASALLIVFGWLCPDRARELPSWLWEEVQRKTAATRPSEKADGDRARLLDSRPWFTPTVEKQNEKRRGGKPRD